MRFHRVLDGHLIHAGNLCTGYCFHVGLEFQHMDTGGSRHQPWHSALASI